MAAPSLSVGQLAEALKALEEHGSQIKAAEALGISRATFQHRVREAKRRIDSLAAPPPFEAEPLPSSMPEVSDLIELRKRAFARKHSAEEARRLVTVKVNIDGPIGIVHMGDPHVDDDGCDISTLEKHVNIIAKTPGLFGANLGDLQNNWIGRLGHLYGEQSTSALEAWVLTEWLVNSVDWLYLVGGNHDCWSGAGDPLKWMMRDQAGVFDAWGVRIALKFPNNREVRINARHDFAGNSMWNPAHGPMKAIQAGWRDHILTCGHKHTSFVGGPLKDPASGLLSWAVRCAGYKVHDRYATQLGLPNQNAFPAAVTIIDPQYGDDNARLVTVIPDVEEAAEFLAWKRRRIAA